MRNRKDKATHQGGHYPKKSEISLFDLPKLMYLAMDTLKKQYRIGRVFPQKIIINDGKVQLHIQYFSALDNIKSAELFNRGLDLNTGLYQQYRLVISNECEVVWTKQITEWVKYVCVK